MAKFSGVLVASLFLSVVPCRSQAAPLESSALELDHRFKSSVLPFVETYCFNCHDKEVTKADLDLSAFTTLNKVVDGYSSWQLVLDKLEAGDMPPAKAKKHPTSKESKEIVEWIQSLRKSEGSKHPGDPGIVLGRRLSNAEYDYTIRDLTGVDLHPTKEFPVDPANQAGFDNTGESLMMSPSLWKKYYQAARQVAESVVLQPEGFTFAPHPMVFEMDRDKYSVLRIVEFYQRQPADYTDYFTAAWRYQYRDKLGMPKATLADVAAQSKVSVKYLTTVWNVLNDKNEKVGPLAKLQTLFRSLPSPAQTSPENIRAVSSQIAAWVLNLRDQIVPDVKNLNAPGFGAGSLPMVLWKDNEMAINHRKFDPTLLKPGKPIATPSLVLTVTPAPAAIASASAAQVLSGQKGPIAKVLETPKAGAKLPNGIGAPSAPVARTNANGEALSAVEVAELALAAQPARKVGGPLPKTPDIVKFGGVFLEAPIIMKASSITARMARAKKRGDAVDPDLIVPENPDERADYEAAFKRFAAIFPDNFFISERARVFLDAEAEESLEGRLLSAGLQGQVAYFRDDAPLYDMILDDAGRRELDRLWDTFNYNASVAPRMYLGYLAGEGGALRGTNSEMLAADKTSVSQEMIKKLNSGALARLERGTGTDVSVKAVKDYFSNVVSDNLWLDRTREAAIPTHLKSLQEFAERAFRRPLSDREREEIVSFYRKSREENGVDHEDAVRDSIVRILMSPYFCYRFDLNELSQKDTTPSGRLPLKASLTSRAPQQPNASAASGMQALTDHSLASRLSYFLWSSMPDQELMKHANTGDLHRPEVILAQTRRMLTDPRVRNFAAEFAGHWLDFRRFEEHNAVDRGRFPSFDNELRQAMYEEPIRFIVDMVQNDRPLLNLLYGDYTFVNGPLARHYGIPGAFGSEQWMRVENASQYDRGGILPMAVFLTANSPGLRTSPVKRGYWVVRRVLGERIPPPPATVPDLPADEKSMGELTLRETLSKHRENQACSGCHARFDSFGLVFEGFGAIGEKRSKDFGGRAVDSQAEFPGGTMASGFSGLRDYIRGHRQRDFIDNFTSKLLSYSLNRSLLMSDDSLLSEMKTRLAAENYRFGSLIETIVASPQFRNKRAATAVAGATAMNAASTGDLLPVR